MLTFLAVCSQIPIAWETAPGANGKCHVNLERPKMAHAELLFVWVQVAPWSS